ncbi:MAG: right-handed parallel beta-helix repeat-containing protein [Verrucomicrobiales bacterium]|jgi:hypothetical protein|nr:right-handed parallel beta-helix repeat-containing protein [Verrucomicrobiales bacterium]
MKTITLILPLLGAAALNAFAVNEVVTSSTTELNQTYEGTATEAALRVEGEGVTYTGENITLSSTFAADDFADFTGKGVYAQNGVILSLLGGSITTSGRDGVGFYLTGASDATLTDVNITTTGEGGYGVYLNYASTLTLTGGAINVSGESSGGLYFQNFGEGFNTATVSGVDINVTGEGGMGLLLESSILTLTNSNINVTDEYGFGLALMNSDATVDLNNNTLTGNIYVGGSELTLTGSNGSKITAGQVFGDDGVIDITLTGDGTVFSGNLNASDEDALTIKLTISAGALLEGGGTVSDLVLNDGASYAYHPDYGTLTITDSIQVGDNITIDFSNLTESEDYTVLDWSDAEVIGTISDSQFTAIGAAGEFHVDANGQLIFTAAIPEPTTWFLLSLGLGALALIRRRRH